MKLFFLRVKKNNIYTNIDNTMSTKRPSKKSNKPILKTNKPVTRTNRPSLKKKRPVAPKQIKKIPRSNKMASDTMSVTELQFMARSLGIPFGGLNKHMLINKINKYS